MRENGARRKANIALGARQKSYWMDPELPCQGRRITRDAWRFHNDLEISISAVARALSEQLHFRDSSRQLPSAIIRI